TNAGKSDVAQSAASFVAQELGGTVNQAQASIETAQRLEWLSAARGAFVAGELSQQQAGAIAAAAITTPALELELLEAAKTEPLPRLKDRCREVEMRADTSPDQSQRRHAKRSVRRYVDDVDG